MQTNYINYVIYGNWNAYNNMRILYRLLGVNCKL